ncbi:luciferin 4-monooxygenase, partial [Aureobasidium melanogenum]
MAQAITIYESPYPDMLIPTDVSMSEYMIRSNPDDVADDKVIFSDLEEPYDSVTYAGLREDTAKNAAWLQSIGLQPGDTVAMYATNSVAWIKAAHAVVWAGGVLAGINAVVSEFELPHYLSVAKPKFVFTDPALHSRVDSALSKLSAQSAKVIDLGTTRGQGFPSNVPHQRPIPPYAVTEDNRKVPAVLLFSSGTTGKPKGVLLSHHNMIGHLLGPRSGSYETIGHHTIEVFYPPLAHMFGIVGAVFPGAYNGSHTVLMRQFDYRKWITACAKIRATSLKSVPAIAVMITKDPEILSGKLDLTSVQYLLCAGAALQQEVVASLQQLLQGVSIVQGFGMSETALSFLRPHRSVEKRGSVGKPFPSVKLRIVDDQYRDVPRNTPGQALVKGPTVFMGYRDNQAATKESFRDGWLCTGDVIAIDDDNFLWFKDRKKEMIKYKGNQVAPAELEDLLNSHPAVAEAGVCAAWDKENQTEIPTAYVVLNPSKKQADTSEVLADIRKFVDTRVTGYKKLRGGVHAIAALPKNVTGKLVRGELPARKEMEKAFAAPKAKL